MNSKRPSDVVLTPPPLYIAEVLRSDGVRMSLHSDKDKADSFAEYLNRTRLVEHSFLSKMLPTPLKHTQIRGPTVNKKTGVWR